MGTRVLAAQELGWGQALALLLWGPPLGCPQNGPSSFSLNCVPLGHPLGKMAGIRPWALFASESRQDQMTKQKELIQKPAYKDVGSVLRISREQQTMRRLAWFMSTIALPDAENIC